MPDSAAEAAIDRGLVSRALLGNDRRAFENLVRRHQGMVRAQLRRLLRSDHAAADDLAQETFLLAWRKLDQFRGEARFATWLYRIAYSCFLQAIRKRPAATDAASDLDDHDLAAPDRAMDLELDLARAMQALSESEQAVLLHCVQLGLSHEETAYVLAMPLGTVKTHARRGKEKLKSHLAAWEDAPHEERS